MKNLYIVDGDITKIRLNTRRGDISWASISTSKVPLADGVPGSWCAMRRRDGSVYAFCKDYTRDKREGGGGGKTRYLHRVVCGLHDDDPRVPNHLDFNGLNCVDSNLEVVTRAQNLAYRRLTSEPAKNNRRSRVRNVRPCQYGFEVVFRGRYHSFHKTLDAAKKVAAKLRADYAAEMYAAAVARKQGKTDMTTRMSAIHDRLEAAARSAA